MSSGSMTPAVRPLVDTAMVVVAVIFPVLSFIAVVLRFLARKKSNLHIGTDDWLTILAWISTFPLSIVPWVYGSKTGVNKFKIDPIEGVGLSIQCIWVTSIFLALCLPIIKISIIFFYKRVFAVKWFQTVSWIAISAISIWGIIFFFLTIFQGHPISIAYTGIGHFSINATAFGLAQASTSFIIDLFVLSLPIPVVYKLHLPRKQKFAVAGIFGLGAFCVVAAVTRLGLLVRSLHIVAESRSSGFAAVDSETKAFIFIIIEPNCSIIASCLPCLGPILLGLRAPESLVRSVRSMISLRSRKSNSQESTGKGSSLPASKLSENRSPPNELATVYNSDLETSKFTSSHNTEGGINVTRTVELHDEPLNKGSAH